MIGHSIGEYVAATVAGVLSLPDALRLVAARGRLMQSMPAGAMLAVSLDEARCAARLPEGLVHRDRQRPRHLRGGRRERRRRRVRRQPAAARTSSKPLRTSHAFHSPMMDPILAEFTALMATVPLRAPGIPFLSNVTGTWITAEQATDPAYWAAHLRQPVRFGDCVATLLGAGTWALLECGPGRQLANLARMQVAKGTPEQRALTPLGSLPGPGEPAGDLACLLTGAGALWCAGIAVRLDADPAARRVPLPTYPFERRRYWVGPGPGRRRWPRRRWRPVRVRCRSGSRCRCGGRPPPTRRPCRRAVAWCSPPVRAPTRWSPRAAGRRRRRRSW